MTANCKDFAKYDFCDTFGSTESENDQHQLPKLQGLAFQKNHEKSCKIIKDTKLHSPISLQIVQCSNFTHLFGRKSNYTWFLLNQTRRNYHFCLILMLNIYSKAPYSGIGSDLDPWHI